MTPPLTQPDVDIAIRQIRSDQPDLIPRHLGGFRPNLYAAWDHLDWADHPRYAAYRVTPHKSVTPASSGPPPAGIPFTSNRALRKLVFSTPKCPR